MWEPEGSQAQSWELDQGMLGNVVLGEELGGSAGGGLGVVREEKRAKAATLTLTSEWNLKC